MEFKLRDAIRNRQSGIVAKATEFENKQIELENRECKSLLDPLSTEREVQVSLDSPFTGQIGRHEASGLTYSNLKTPSKKGAPSWRLHLDYSFKF